MFACLDLRLVLRLAKGSCFRFSLRSRQNVSQQSMTDGPGRGCLLGVPAAVKPGVSGSQLFAPLCLVQVQWSLDDLLE
jgi:hypothetical protein